MELGALCTPISCCINSWAFSRCKVFPSPRDVSIGHENDWWETGLMGQITYPTICCVHPEGSIQRAQASIDGGSEALYEVRIVSSPKSSGTTTPTLPIPSLPWFRPLCLCSLPNHSALPYVTPLFPPTGAFPPSSHGQGTCSVAYDAELGGVHQTYK